MTPNNQEMHAELEARPSSWLSRHTFFAMLIVGTVPAFILGLHRARRQPGLILRYHSATFFWGFRVQRRPNSRLCEQSFGHTRCELDLGFWARLVSLWDPGRSAILRPSLAPGLFCHTNYCECVLRWWS
jgi:hypothetical protein